MWVSMADDNIAPKIFGKAMRRKGDVWTHECKDGQTAQIRRMPIEERVGTIYRFQARVYKKSKEDFNAVADMKWSTKLEASLWLERKLLDMGCSK